MKYNHITGQQAFELPKTLSTSTGVILMPTPDDLIAAGWCLPDVIDEPIPDGMVRREWTGIDIVDGVPVRRYVYITQVEADAEAATQEAAEASRIQGLAETYGERVAALAALLDALDYEMPIDYEVVANKITHKVLTGELLPEQQSKAALLPNAYERCREVMSDEDMVKVGDVLKAMVQ